MTDEIDKLINDDDESKPVPFSNPIPDEQLGHVSAENTGLKVGRDENVIFSVIHPNKRDEVEVGDYVRIPYYTPDEDSTDVETQLLASINSLSYETSLEDRRFTSSDNFGFEQYNFIAELNPISEISLNTQDEETDFNGDFVSRPPLPTVLMDKVKNKSFLRSGLDVPSEGAYIGDIAVNGVRVPDESNPLGYFLFNPNQTDGTGDLGEPSIFRHILVAGSTGTGKTHTSKNILRQLAKCKAYTIDIPAEEQSENTPNTRERALNLTIIDPEDEYTELGEDPYSLANVKEICERRTDVEYGAIDDNRFNIFAPVTSDSRTGQLRTSGNKVTNFGIPFEIVKNHQQIMMPNDPPGPTKQLISNILGQYFNTRSNYSYQDFKQWFKNDKRPEVMESDKYSDGIVNAASRRITDRKEYDAVFDESTNDFTDTNLLHKMFDSNQVSVITTGHLRGATQNLVVQSLSSYIVESKISSDPASPTIKGTPMVLALDEAHEYVQNPETTREYFIVNKFRRAARRGRKDKFGLYFITQNPADIDGEVRNQINTKIYMQLDSRVVNGSDVFIPPQFRNQISEFNKGQMVVVQPDVNPVEVQGLRYCLVKHSK